MNKKTKQKTPLFAIIAAIIVIAVASFTYFVISYNNGMANNTAMHEVTIEGKVVCLQHRNTSGAQTLECAVGLQSTDGKYYSISSDPSDITISAAAGSDRKIRIRGLLTEKADSKYISDGVITVRDFEFLS
jgi:hypothetical protein